MNPKILIADDEPNILISLEFLMKREGYQVVVAGRVADPSLTLGPALGTAWDSTKKMPVPTVAPTPNIVS